MITVVNTTQRANSFSSEVAERISDILLSNGTALISEEIEDNGFAKEYMEGGVSIGESSKKVIFVIPSYYKNMPPIFLEWLNNLSSEQFEHFDNKPILIVSVQGGFSIDSLPETIARTTICQAIKFNGYLSNISPNWIGCTDEWFKADGSEEKFKEKILDFANNYE